MVSWKIFPEKQTGSLIGITGNLDRAKFSIVSHFANEQRQNIIPFNVYSASNYGQGNKLPNLITLIENYGWVLIIPYIIFFRRDF